MGKQSRRRRYRRWMAVVPRSMCGRVDPESLIPTGGEVTGEVTGEDELLPVRWIRRGGETLEVMPDGSVHPSRWRVL